MNLRKSFVFIALLMILGFIISSYSSAAELTDVYLEILEGDMTIGSTSSIDLWSFTVSSSNQDADWTFADYFWVEDLKWDDAGWYTTIQASDMNGDNGVIDALNISMKIDSTDVDLIGWSTNNSVDIASAWSSYQAVDSPLTFIQRTNGTNNGLLWKYGVKPDLRITIPAYQSVGSYTSTITYTLIEN